MKLRKCGNCKHRFLMGWMNMLECCLDYEMACNEEDEVKAASTCPIYEEGTPECIEEDRYCPSSTAGDYSPSSPWNAPGMSIKDFI